MALILTRKPNERVMIGEHIVVMVAGVKGNYVRLSIEAPPDVKILREEARGHAAEGCDVSAEHLAADPVSMCAC